MYTRVNAHAPQHLLAKFPFTAGVTSRACVTPKSARPGARCVKQWITAGMVTVDCVPGAGGAPGTITASYTNAEGVVMVTNVNTVVASCDASLLSEPSTCSLQSGAATVRTATAVGLELQSSDWDSQCRCLRTGRWPIFSINVPTNIIGSGCT